jgi:hypothetical protein
MMEDILYPEALQIETSQMRHALLGGPGSSSAVVDRPPAAVIMGPICANRDEVPAESPANKRPRFCSKEEGAYVFSWLTI